MERDCWITKNGAWVFEFSLFPTLEEPTRVKLFKFRAWDWFKYRAHVGD